ncbi:NAD-dependent succinate-semialdehyde dehydrogenase [Halomonas piscis]|uniref:NAD-dependent succinate-semialdehyde dehydrogenase n=1 Tax=Halomonas piscis TaxID=3031727 RepID=A0ABY9YXU0_9GAMM|nr:NAD-dependent succinate-semialdehyde dehydrogenase [Halomonas piscis]WNK19601.1 NAD-dependent succinate-semialdehyde dehydrogenase [Halomonas piscis]
MTAPSTLLSDRLQDPRLIRQYAYLNGKWTHGEGGREEPVTDPATGEVLGHIPVLEEAQITAAVDAADAAFAGWRALRANERSEILEAWYALLQENSEDLATIMTLEQGKAIGDSRGEVQYGASFIRWFAEEGKRTYGDTIPSHMPNAALGSLKEPVGIAALITPWNFPLAMITRKAAAALAAGCPVVIKPSNETPFTALALAELGERAGIPAGVLNVVLGEPSTVSKVLCAEPRIRALSFTGSTRVGELLMEQSASTVKRLSMELGGNAPFIVGPDMDPKEAAEAAVAAKFQTSGQDCLAANRILVHESIHEAFVEAFKESMSALKVGNGLEDGVDLGPLIHGKAVEKAQSIVDDAVDKGATLHESTQTPVAGDNFFMPVLLTGITRGMKVWDEESFSPVAGILPYSTDEEAIELANDTEYGLASYLYTHDVRRIWKIMRGLEFGLVSVNSVKMTGAPVPFGGVKESGLGREGGPTGIEEYLETKFFCLGGMESASGS